MNKQLVGIIIALSVLLIALTSLAQEKPRLRRKIISDTTKTLDLKKNRKLPRPVQPDKIVVPDKPETGWTLQEEWYWGCLCSDKNECENLGASQVSSLPVVANLTDDNGDGKINEKDIPEIVFVAYTNPENCKDRGRLTALHGHTGDIYFQISDSDKLLRSDCNVAIGDINDDGKPEVVAQLSRHYISPGLVAFTNTGQELWRNNDLEGEWDIQGGSVGIADLNHDGIPEIIFGKMVFSGATGSMLAKGSANLRGSNQQAGSITCAVDIIAGGNLEIVVGSELYSYQDKVADRLEYEGRATYSGGNVPDGFCAVADVDLDGNPEVVLAAEGKIFIIEHNWTVSCWVDIDAIDACTADQGRLGAPAIANMDSDPYLEIGVAGKQSYLVLENDLSLKWEFPIENDATGMSGSSFCDLNGDGKLEILFNDENYFHIFEAATGKILVEVLNSSRIRTGYPVVADVDRDDEIEIVICHSNEASYLLGASRPPTSGCGIRVFGSEKQNWVKGRPIWNQYSYHHTNVENDGSIPRYETKNWLHYNNDRTAVSEK